VAARALLNGDGGGEAFDGFDIGLLQLIEKLPGVGGQRFHILSLALGEDGVERQR